MSRFLAPTDCFYGVDVPFGNAKRYNGQVFEVTDTHHARLLKEAGFTEGDIAGGPSRSAGFYCEPCSFASFFRLCSRCGGTCDRPDIVA